MNGKARKTSQINTWINQSISITDQSSVSSVMSCIMLVVYTKPWHHSCQVIIRAHTVYRKNIAYHYCSSTTMVSRFCFSPCWNTHMDTSSRQFFSKKHNNGGIQSKSKQTDSLILHSKIINQPCSGIYLLVHFTMAAVITATTVSTACTNSCFDLYAISRLQNDQMCWCHQRQSHTWKCPC